MRSLLVSLFVLSFVSVSVVACDGDVDDSCDEEGVVDGECDDGLVCGKAKKDSSDLMCLKQCNSANDCRAGEDCYSVSNTSLKGCRPRD